MSMQKTKGSVRGRIWPAKGGWPRPRRNSTSAELRLLRKVGSNLPFLLLMIRCMRLVKHARAVLTAATKHSLDYASKKNVQPAVPSQLNKLHAFLL
ncbi:hypothetical protein Y032_0048g1575 [Ancylostoma ceylanicum]|uniref:Uncharacterized protein n=1 Tax=Ancylostoma ceylanicum TaxID=53326 RepID=A0A016UBT1_9BILA|nr:hypothetical protein Y032_0048g1575 [Ancylostoma ceylanicum]